MHYISFKDILNWHYIRFSAPPSIPHWHFGSSTHLETCTDSKPQQTTTGTHFLPFFDFFTGFFALETGFFLLAAGFFAFELLLATGFFFEPPALDLVLLVLFFFGAAFFFVTLGLALEDFAGAFLLLLGAADFDFFFIAARVSGERRYDDLTWISSPLSTPRFKAARIKCFLGTVW